MMESRLVDRKLDPTANAEDVIAKFVFSLLRQLAKKFSEHVDYHVFIDSPTGKEENADALYYSLNYECVNALGFKRGPFRTVKFVLSKNVRGVQAADLITGAVAYETNRQNDSAKRSPHQRLWSELLTASSLTTFAEPTKRFPKQFQIWHFDFAKSKFTRFNTEISRQSAV